METVDLTKVAGFKALDSDGNELGIVSMEQLTDSIAMRIADGLSERTVLPANNVPMAVAATSTGSDKIETAFSETTDPAYVRVIDKNGNSAKQGISSLSSVVGGLLPVATLTQKGLMDSYHTRSIGDGFVINTQSGIKGKYVKILTINNYNGTIAFIEMCSYGDSSYFYVALSLGNGTQTKIAFRSGKILFGALSGFRFYVVGLSVYMFVPSTSKDCYVYVANRQGIVHDGKDISDSIDTSAEISIS